MREPLVRRAMVALFATGTVLVAAVMAAMERTWAEMGPGTTMPVDIRMSDTTIEVASFAGVLALLAGVGAAVWVRAWRPILGVLVASVVAKVFFAMLLSSELEVALTWAAEMSAVALLAVYLRIRFSRQSAAESSAPDGDAR